MGRQSKHRCQIEIRYLFSYQADAVLFNSKKTMPGVVRNVNKTAKPGLMSRPLRVVSQYQLCWVRKWKWFFRMHNIVEGGSGRVSEEEGKMNFFQPRHSPLPEHRTLRSSFNFLSRFSPARKTRYMKTVFPFSLFFSSTRKNHCRRPYSFHRFKLLCYYRICLLNFSHHTSLLQPLLDEGTKPQKSKFSFC